MARGKAMPDNTHVQDYLITRQDNVDNQREPCSESEMDVDLSGLSLEDQKRTLETENSEHHCKAGRSVNQKYDLGAPWVTGNSLTKINGTPVWSSSTSNTSQCPSLPDQQFERHVQQHLGQPVLFDAVSVFSQDADGDTQLHLAIIHEQTLLVMQLISYAPNCEWLNIVNRRLQSPLHLAVITKQTNIVRRLMVAGARVDRTDINGNTPLHIACREGYADIVECLLRPVCFEETQVNKYEIPYQKFPQDLNTRNFAGHTCVHLAALSTHLKALELLVSRGADVNVKDGTSGRTALHYAAETGNRILMHFLLTQRNVNVSCRTFGDLTPLELASGRRFGDVVSVLIANGADFNDLDNSDDDL